MVFDQTIYVANTSGEKIYVRTTYEKWQQLKFSTEVKLLSGGVAGGGFNFERDGCDFTEGFTALAPHHTLKMIGSFFSAECRPIDAGVKEGRFCISRNFRVPNKHSIVITPLHTVQVVRSGDRWKKLCRESCVYMFGNPKTKRSLWKRIRRRQEPVSTEACDVCTRKGASSSKNTTAPGLNPGPNYMYIMKTG